MDAQDTATLEAGQRVGLAARNFVAEAKDFAPVQDAVAEIDAFAEALAQKQRDQGQDTGADTDGKDQARERMALAADTLSKRAVAYALVQKDVKLKQQLTLSYTDVRYGEETEDVNHVRDLIAHVQALPADARKRFRLTPELLAATEATVQAFEQAGTDQTIAKAAVRLATQSVPELLTGLRGQLLVLAALLAGMKDESPRWEAFHQAFLDANKRRTVAPKRRLKPTTRVVRRFALHRQDDRPGRPLDTRDYTGPYAFTVENQGASPLLLWLAQADGAPVAPAPAACPAGQITVVERAALGPATATHLLARFAGPAGDEARITVRRLAAEE